MRYSEYIIYVSIISFLVFDENSISRKGETKINERFKKRNLIIFGNK